MHWKVTSYLNAVKKLYPGNFEKVEVLDCWALNINWTNRIVLENCDYIWLDIIPWKNIDVVCPIKDYNPLKKFKTIICTECLEHDITWKQSIQHMYDLLADWWLLVVTTAWIWRREHWTYERWPSDSPATNDYYRNLDSEDILWILSKAIIEEDSDRSDIRFHIIKE